MTNRFARMYQKVRDRLGGRRKLALAVVAIWIAAELVAAAAVVVAGKEWFASAKSAGGGGTAAGFSVTHSAPSLAVF